MEDYSDKTKWSNERLLAGYKLLAYGENDIVMEEIRTEILRRMEPPQKPEEEEWTELEYKIGRAHV